MTLFFDGERLDGPHVARISARPRRVAVPFDIGTPSGFREAIELECQLWGGGANVLLPIDSSGSIPSMYRTILPGSQIDDVHGAGYDPEMSCEGPIELTKRRDVTRAQLAVGLLTYKKPKKMAPVEVVSLETTDAWSGIYTACLGSLPETIDPEILRSGNWLPELQFSDWVEVRRSTTTGSLSDLISRTWPREPMLTPRQLSLVKLSYASTASTSIRSDRPVLPDPRFARYDAGPNVLVVCAPDSMDDLALLWNLRAAHGDFYATPIGVPLEEYSADTLRQLTMEMGLARHGFSSSSLYVTSVSVPLDTLEEITAQVPHVSARAASDLLMFGSILGLERDEILVWNDGRASYKPLDPASHNDVLANHNVNDLLIMQYDVYVQDAPLPLSDDYRIDPMNGAFYNGAHSVWSSPRKGTEAHTLEWPSRATIANSLAARRDLHLTESAPGIAARILVEMLGDLDGAYMLHHAPLLALLESMSARQGFNWYKKRLRQAGLDAHASEAVGASIDELPEMSFHDFKKVLGNNDAATKYWLAWAERSHIIIKGFPIQCPQCGAKQWIPIGSFAPPIACRGCAKTIDFPFSDRPVVDFKYRLSEQTRRVYEIDAMGHILAGSFFASMFGFGSQSRLIGLQLGTSVRRPESASEIGEADVLMLTRWGEFIPIEVKRTATGLTDREIQKLGTLAEALRSPWSGVVACQYATDADRSIDELPVRNADGTHNRIALTYDHLLQPHPMWGASQDPFAPLTLSRDEINEREKGFVSGLAKRAKEPDIDWFTYSMMRRRKTPGPKQVDN